MHPCIFFVAAQYTKELRYRKEARKQQTTAAVGDHDVTASSGSTFRLRRSRGTSRPQSLQDFAELGMDVTSDAAPEE